MAFGKKYYSSYKSNNNIDYYLEIWLKDYDSTASEITIGAGGPVINYETEEDDRFSPILSSNCKLPLVVTNIALQTFVSQLRTTYQEKEVYLHLYKATSTTYTTTKPIWSGFLTMDLGSGEDVSFPYEQQLIFIDGLSLLKEIDFVDFSDPDYESRTPGNYAPENMYWGPARYIYWIKEILLKSGAAISGVNGQGVSQDYGFTTAVNWYNGEMTSTSQSSDPLYLTECKASMFHTKDENGTFMPDNCYDVLKELLRHWGARITYWKHEFWIVQIPEYIIDESGFIDNPDNINSRQYSKTGAYLGSQDHLGDTYSSRYEQTIQSDQISKLVGTKYNYLPSIHRVNAKFLSLNGENHYGGFPFGINPYGIDFFQGRINSPSSADFLWVSIPLNWKWDMTGSGLLNGHTNGWWARIKFNLYCTQNIGGTITTYYLQYNSSNDSYYWVDSSNWTPLGNESPAYIISSRNLVETDYIGFQEQIEFVDSSGSNISLTGDWDFYISIENYGTSSNNPGSFYCRFSPGGQIKRNPTLTSPNVPAPGGSGTTTSSGTVSWSNSLQDNSIAFNSPTLSSVINPSGYNTGAIQIDVGFTWKSPLKGFLQVLTNTANATYGNTNTTIVSGSTNTEIYGFGDLLWGDCLVKTARGNLNVWDGSSFVKTNLNGKWGRGTLTGEKTFTQMLIDEFLTGQIQVIISPSMRLVVGEQNKNQTATASGGGTATRPRYVNPIGRLRETRSNETDPEYFFRRGSFHTLYDEWDYEGYQIIRDTITVTTNTNDIGSLGGSQNDNPIDAAKVKSNVENALIMNSPVAYVRTTVPATGSNVIVNGNFNVATSWTLGTGWTIDTTEKKAKFAATGSTSDLTQSVLTAELTYQINFTIEVTAGSLTVKAGSSGTTQTITASGDYSIYLDCEGSSDIKFTAGTTFTGTITFITAKDQKSLTSIPIETIGTAVFKTNDTLDLVNSRDGEIMTLNVSSNQGASDDTISVTSTLLYEDIAANSVLLINQDDLSAQYQNKTKGTVGGFDITATSIDSGSVAISSYIDDDTFATASATSLATSESIKAYVDGQAGHSETLQGVTDNGNTTTNSITFAGGTSTADINGQSITLGDGSADKQLKVFYSDGSFISYKGYGIEFNRTYSYLTPTATNSKILNIGHSSVGGYWLQVESKSVTHIWSGASSEKMRLTSDGKLLIGTTIAGDELTVAGNIVSYHTGYTTDAFRVTHNSNDVFLSLYKRSDQSNPDVKLRTNGDSYINGGNLGINTSTPTEKLHVVGDILATGDSHADAFKPAVSGNPIKFKNFDSSTEFARITDSGNVLIGGTTDLNSAIKLQLTNSADNRIQITTSNGFSDASLDLCNTSDNKGWRVIHRNNTNFEIQYASSLSSGIIGGVSTALAIDSSLNTTLSGSLTGTTATFNDVFFGTSTYKGKLSWDTGKVLIGTSTANTDIVFIRNFNTELARITSGGNVGIGTSSPAQLLTIYKDSGDANLLISSNNGASQIFFGDTEQDNIGKIDYDHSDNSLNIAVNNAERARITSGGNLLIGTTTDSGAKLNVNGTILCNNELQFTNSAMRIYRSSDNMKFRTNNTDKLTITSGGNVLIGTTTDDGSSKLQVDGDVKFYGDTSGRDMLWDASQDRLEFQDNAKAVFGTDSDLIIYNDGTNSVIATQNTSGNLIITQNVDNADLVLKCDDGSGGQTAYITLDGSQTTINLFKTVLIGTTTNTGAYKIDVAGKQRVQDTLELDDVLMLNAISTPSDPAANKSVIYMDSSDGGIKCKINVGGTTVTRTLASFE